MSVLFRCRMDKKVLEKANKVTDQLGTSTPEMVRVFVAQIARTGQVPVALRVGPDESLAGDWETRARTLESFYEPGKAW